MISVDTKVTLNAAAVKMLNTLGPRAVNALLLEIRARAVLNLHGVAWDTGNLARSIAVAVDPGGLNGSVFTTTGYGGWVEIGTGLYGPHKTRIVPKVKKALAWPDKGGYLAATGYKKPRKASTWGKFMIVRRSVKGRKATPYLIPAVEEVRRGAEQILRPLFHGGV